MATQIEAQLDQLRQAASRLGVSPEDLLQIGVEYVLSQPDVALAGLLTGQPSAPQGDSVQVDGPAPGLPAPTEPRRRALAALALQNAPPPPARDAWRKQFGLFADDPLMAEVVEAGRQWRAEKPAPR